MRLNKVIYLIITLTVLLAAGFVFQDKKMAKGKDKTTRYELVKKWFNKLPDGLILGNPTGIGIDTNHNIFVFHRAGREWPLFGSMPGTCIKEKTILLVHRDSGKVLRSWGDNVFIMPHGLTVDKNNNVWVTDVGLHQVFKFDHNGKLLMILGAAKVPGSDTVHFNRPTDVAVAGDGSFFVSDGYGNSRIIKFSAEGKYLLQWGRRGSKAGEFNIPHSIDVDANGHVYVADRENNRIQVFDPVGRFLKQYNNKDFGQIYSVAVERNGRKMFATDDLAFLKIKHRGSDILAMDTKGTVQTRLGRSGFYDGQICWYHDIAIDDEQSIYVCDMLGNQVQKFKEVLVQ